MKTKIGIIEDELSEAKAVSKLLVNLGYEVTTPAHDYDEAIEMIKSESPNLLLLDINLNGNLDGIEVANLISNFYQLPYIFHSSNLNPELIERAKNVKPSAYLTKPAAKEQLYTAIELAMNNHYVKQNNCDVGPESKPQVNSKCDFVYVFDGQNFRKVCFEELLYIKSESNYVGLHFTNGTNLLVRSTLNEFSLQLDKKRFIRIHRCYIVNTQNIDKVSSFEIMIKGADIPLSKVYREELFNTLGIENRKLVS